MTTAELVKVLHGPPVRIHLIGVSGSGMSGLAALLLALGHRVSGSDRTETAEVVRLSRKGLQFTTPHDPAQVADARVVLYSSAVKEGNPSYDEAVRLDLPRFRRAEALAAIMAGKKGIIVCGMHGKTTTSAMCAHALRAAGAKPSHYVGAEIPILGTNARWDSDGEFFVAEGDESDGTLTLYHPEHTIVLNIEPEHLDFYRDLDAIDAVFSQLLQQTSGWVVYCGDDGGARRLCAGRERAVSYGEETGNDFRLVGLRMDDGRPLFRVQENGVDLGEVHLGIPGKHNAFNALAVIALARRLGLDFAPVAGALAGFEGARRRFETIHQDPDFRVVDDYGHHPTEIAATLQTARMTGARRTVVLFQPHRYSRTAALREIFGSAFAESEILALTEVYPAGEKPLPGIGGETVAESARQAGHQRVLFTPEVRLLPRLVGPLLEPGDLILSLGAGNIHEAGKALAADLALRREICSVMEGGLVRLYEPLSRHTTMRVGGPARFWAEPEKESGFADLARFCADRSLPLLVMGRGSNLLVRDGGWPGVVAHLVRGEFSRHEVKGHEITAGVGVRFKQLAALARKAGLTDFEWMEGIPGNLGGGLRMNAGAMGWQTFDQVVRVRFCDEDGNIFTRTPEELEIHYRNVPALQKNYALSATLRGHPAPDTEIAARMHESEKKRKATQPVAASAGCIFKNPGSLAAGKLIDELGLKGFAIGRARVSDVHANFIVNDGGATAGDVLALIEKIKQEARLQRGLKLETEVQIIGVEEGLSHAVPATGQIQP
jgi:UDP-N-acetylmuramate--alanine ligase